MSKKIPMPLEAAQAMKGQGKVFRKKLHCDPEPGVPALIDSDADTRQPYSEGKMVAMFEEMIATAKEARIPLELVYAMRKTGRIVTERNKHLYRTCSGCRARWQISVKLMRGGRVDVNKGTFIRLPHSVYD